MLSMLMYYLFLIFALLLFAIISLSSIIFEILIIY